MSVSISYSCGSTASEDQTSAKSVRIGVESRSASWLC
jgi:hypothetical protein